MNIFTKITVLCVAAAVSFACRQNEQIDFNLDSDNLEIGAEGGIRRINVSASGAWTASANVPWITISPANGNGSQECQIIVDSTIYYLADEASRSGVVTIMESETSDSRDINVKQAGYGYSITLEEDEIDIPEYDVLSDRWFDVKVKSNVKFDLAFKDKAGEVIDWIEADEDNPELELTKGARPRSVTLRFDWEINQHDEDRIAKIEFVPVDDNGAPIAYNPSNVARIDTVKVTQTSAEPIVENTRQGDSTSLVAISRALNVWSGGWDTTQPMEMWSDVILWENTGDRQKDGRVRYVRFFMFNTEDGLPYQVRYLTAAEEIVFYSNENNTLRKDIDLGEDICQLGQLKRLTISAYGLDDNSIPESFYTSFPDLEYLNLSSNNFTAIPEGINPVNFPKLHAFMMSNNQRSLVYDTQNAAVNNDEQFAEKYAGLFNENKNPENADAGGGLPLRFLRWEKLDTLQLSLNYLQGELPTDSYLLSHNFEPWTADYKLIDEEGEEILNVADSLKGGNPEFFQTRSIPRVLPRLKSLAINLNRFTGALPNWILYHPNLDLWDPYTLLFNQEGRDREGTTAGFSGTPSNLNYYYDVYGNKKYDPDNAPSDE